MPEAAIRVVDVYPYRRTREHPEFLLFRRASDVPYAGQWRMIGGKIEEEEAAWEAALREVKEETGQAPDDFWALPSLNTFYEWQADRVNLIPAFAAALSESPVLDDEHEAFEWLAPSEAAERLQWPEQQRLLRLATRLLRSEIPPRLFIDRHQE